MLFPFLTAALSFIITSDSFFVSFSISASFSASTPGSTLAASASSRCFSFSSSRDLSRWSRSAISAACLAMSFLRPSLSPSVLFAICSICFLRAFSCFSSFFFSCSSTRTCSLEAAAPSSLAFRARITACSWSLWKLSLCFSSATSSWAAWSRCAPEDNCASKSRTCWYMPWHSPFCCSIICCICWAFARKSACSSTSASFSSCMRCFSPLSLLSRDSKSLSDFSHSPLSYPCFPSTALRWLAFS
mmetsp:Transcript_10250/g.20946  ORF Transcript_10250/g.20946 Transcript_10250/m.20946 type:complete len:245 (-) Transcript_10250:353-1087(-)